MHHLLKFGGLLLGLAGLTLVLLSASWRLRPALDRAGSVRLRKLLLLALALAALALLRFGDGTESSWTPVIGLATLVGVGMHVVANNWTPPPEVRVAKVQEALFRGVLCLALSIAACSQQGRVKLWQVERDLRTIQRNAAPLVASLESFRAELGRWPESTEEFVRYAAPDVANGLERVRWRIKGSDVSEVGLVVDYFSVLDWDYFVYAPGIELPDDLPAMRFGDWVYYDE